MKTLVSAAAVTALAGSAFGLGETLDRTNTPIFTIDSPGVSITKRDLTAPTPVGRAGVTVYEGLSGGGYVASAPSTGGLGVEDYGTVLSSSGAPNGTPTTQLDTFGLVEYGFAGGVTAANGILFFEFYYNNFSFAGSFGVQLPSAGNFIWTITIGNPAATQIPTEGYHQIFANNNPNIGPVTSGQWFLGPNGANPTIGHNDSAWDNGSFDYGTTTTPSVLAIGQSFRLNAPAPGAAALMGLAGLAGIRRRR
jgi:hypothetical protein